MNFENKELKNFVKTFTGCDYRAILFNPVYNTITAHESLWTIIVSQTWDTNSTKRQKPQVLDFENDEFLIKKLCAYYALICSKTIRLDKETFFEMVEVALFDYLEDDKFVSAYLSWLERNSYKQIYERLLDHNKNKSFLYHYPELKTKLETLFVEYKVNS